MLESSKTTTLPTSRLRAKGTFDWSLAAGILILAVYLGIALFRLGDRTSPVSFWNREPGSDCIVMDFGEEQDIGILFYYLGNYEKRAFTIETRSGEDDAWEPVCEATMARAYQWGKIPVRRIGRFLRLTPEDARAQIGELIVKDARGRVLRPANAQDYPALFDEPDTFCGRFTWQAGTVFDESVFARTAYEFLQGEPAFEDTHPPLGKLLIAAGIAVFGMHPFGWRIAGVIAGTALLALLWRFAARVTRDRWITVGVMALVACDFMHMTESRLGQVDVFLVLFMTGMFYFMYRFYEQICLDGELERTGEEGEAGTVKPPKTRQQPPVTGRQGWKDLLLSGICMGCAIACKWSGCYGAAGLALIWLTVMTIGVRRGRIDWDYVRRTTAACVGFFVLIPAAIYITSYLPFRHADPTLGFWEGFLQNQSDIFRYHSTHGVYHPQASQWFQWPFVIKPIRLWAVWFDDGTAEILMLMGNPVFWWTGIVIVLACAAQALERKDGRAAFLLIGYLAPILPWVGIARYSFLYHYYPSVPFLALLMGHWACGRGRRGRIALAVCLGLSAAAFGLYYPLISGGLVEQSFVEQYLQWLPVWEFTKR